MRLESLDLGEVVVYLRVSFLDEGLLEGYDPPEAVRGKVASTSRALSNGAPH